MDWLVLSGLLGGSATACAVIWGVFYARDRYWRGFEDGLKWRRIQDDFEARECSCVGGSWCVVHGDVNEVKGS